MPRGGEECCGRRRRPGAGSQALRPPSAKMEDAHFPCAAPSPRAGHGTHARSFEDLKSPTSLLARLYPSAPFTHPPLPRRGRESELNTRPASSSRYQCVSTARSSVPWREPPARARSRAGAAGAISRRGLGGSGGTSLGSPRGSLALGRRRSHVKGWPLPPPPLDVFG